MLFLIYMPTAASTWGLLGDLAAGMCVDSLCDGPVGILLLILIIIVISMLIIIIHYYSFYLTNIFHCSVPFSAPSDFLWPLLTFCRAIAIPTNQPSSSHLLQAKLAVEFLFLIHLITAFPILMNPPSQMFEGILNIPLSKKIRLVERFKFLPLHRFLPKKLSPS